MSVRDGFSFKGHPEHDDVVEVLVEPPDGNGWVILQARWCAHLGQWIRDWTKRPILDQIVGWRPKITCARCVPHIG